jgi:integrase
VPSSLLGTWEHVGDNMGTAVGAPTPQVSSVSVHRDRGARVVRWRQDGRQRARRFKTEPEAPAFEDGLSGGPASRTQLHPERLLVRDAGRRPLAPQLPRLARPALEQARFSRASAPWRATASGPWRRCATGALTSVAQPRCASGAAATRPLERAWLRLHEIGRYLDACGPVYRPLGGLLIGSGARISEALALRWHDVDFEPRVLRVYRSDKRAGEGSTTGKRFRSVQVGPALLDTLRDLRARQAEAEAGGLTRACLHDACQNTQARTRPVALYAGPRAPGPQHLLDKLAQAGACGRRAARHAAPCPTPYGRRGLASDGHPLIHAQRQLGHASIKTTESYYGHLDESFLKSAPPATEAAIRQASRSSTL